ncbi:hypothetical protein ADK67_15960 [Saccharothrix sp. NRRL B-16348]|nr:hypothetical protein ADK67_15960 [Saccharothrix sp. NRRL B-16348]
MAARCAASAGHHLVHRARGRPAARRQCSTSAFAQRAWDVPINGTAKTSSARRPSGVLRSFTQRATAPSTGCTVAGRSVHTSSANVDTSSSRQQPCAGVTCRPGANRGSRVTTPHGDAAAGGADVPAG